MRFVLILLASFTVHSSVALAAGPAQGPGRLPVREVTAFKDGHAYVLREEALATPDGSVVLDELPTPVLGTFWPFASGGAKVVSAIAGRTKVAEWAEAFELREVLAANVGKTVKVFQKPTGFEPTGPVISGKVLPIPKRAERDGAPQSSIFLLDVRGDTRAIPFDSVRDLEVQGTIEKGLQREVEKERLTLRVEGGGPAATVGVVYVQMGLRWIPAYKIDLDGAGKARVQLEGTLVNDLIDLADVTVNLVIGVPRFEFRELKDPISLQQELAQISAAQRIDMLGSNRLSNAFSNSITSQSAGFQSGEGNALPPRTLEEGQSAEDLFVFTVQHVTLAKGERIVLPITGFNVDYRDVYRLDVPLAPPVDAGIDVRDERAISMARELSAPKARHVVRLENDSITPFTTAPALVLANGRVLAQGRMTYSPAGTEADLEVTTAVDVGVQVGATETARTQNAVDINGTSYARVDLEGTIELRNSKREAIELDVRRHVLGQIDHVGAGGTKRQLDLVAFWNLELRPMWTQWWSFPWWWSRLNGFGELRWKVKLEPGATTKLDARWHYFWN